jgi:hypothetical protein
MARTTAEQLTLFAGDFPVRISAPPAAGMESKEPNPASGWRCSESSEEPDPLFASLKTHLSSTIAGSISFSQTWKKRVTPAGRLWWALEMPAHPINAPGSSWLLTPTRNDYKGAGPKEFRECSRWLQGERVKDTYKRLRGVLCALDKRLGRPNPEYLAWMMGFPPGQTKLSPTETP